MNKKERIGFISQTLEQLYPETPIPLEHSDPYTLLIAILLSAQRTDERVNKITPEFFKLANNPMEMSNQDVEVIKAIIRPFGLQQLNSKTKNMH